MICASSGSTPPGPSAVRRIASLLLPAVLLSCAGPDAPRFASVYAGRYTDNSLPEEIALLRPLDIEDATMVAGAYSQVIHQPSERYWWEIEGNVAQWFRDQDHTEINGLLTWRWLDFVWDDVIDTSFAFGNGLSWATSVPDLEAQFHPDTGGTQLLWHIAVELEFAIPGTTSWSSFFRVHHRSGVFGTFDDVDGGSNVLALGVRRRL